MPALKVIAVAVPKAVATPELLATVGLLVPIVAAPEKVRLLEPV